jgi:hypothetical protein
VVLKTGLSVSRPIENSGVEWVLISTLNLPIIFQIPTSSFGQFPCSFSFPGTGNERRQRERARARNWTGKRVPLGGPPNAIIFTSLSHFAFFFSLPLPRFPRSSSSSSFIFPALLLPPSPFRSLYRGRGTACGGRR